jgi:hypothetical protein
LALTIRSWALEIIDDSMFQLPHIINAYPMSYLFTLPYRFF